jgi:hypothetical protein
MAWGRWGQTKSAQGARRMTSSNLRYLFHDEFTTALAAGAVINTAAEPGPGTRLGADTEKISISSGALQFAQPAVSAWGANGVVENYPIPRVAGRMVLAKAKAPTTSIIVALALHPNTNTPSFGDSNHQLRFDGSSNLIDDRVLNVKFGPYTDTSEYILSMALRAVGCFQFVQGGTEYPNFELMWDEDTQNTATLYAANSNYNGFGTNLDYIRVPNALWTPVPLASDSFNRAALGSTDGAGHAEANGGGGLAWNAVSGTPAIATNKLTFTAAGVTTLPALSTADVLLNCKVTLPASGVTPGGILLRYSDADNYWYVKITPGTAGNDFELIERNAGVETQRSAADVDWVAGQTYTIRVAVVGNNRWRIYADKSLKITYTTENSFNQTAKVVGLKDEGNSNFVFDSLIVWAKGTSGEYSFPFDAYSWRSYGLFAGNIATFSAEPATEDDFTIIYLPDTQMASADYPAVFAAQSQWIVDNAAALKIKMVLHLGDMVNVPHFAQEWVNAKAAMDILQTANVPNLIVPGNHDYLDMDYTTRDLTTFNSNFPATHYTGKDWFTGGFYDPAASENVYTILTVGAYQYLFMALEYRPRAEVVAWANAIISANQDKRCFIHTHIYLNNNNLRLDPHGEELWTGLGKLHNHIPLIASGHVETGQGYRIDRGDSQNTVHQFLADYQQEPNGGNGWLRIVTVKPRLRQMLMQTYSPTLDQWHTTALEYYLMRYW